MQNNISLNNKSLISKYDIPAPRYTSYPTVPFWDNSTINEDSWKKHIKDTFDKTNKSTGISLYIHLPFCEQLCTYCGCNKRITKNHTVEAPYIDSVIKEWKMYKQLFSEPPVISELHLGGGTPTFFSAEHLKLLIENILEGCIVPESHDYSIEVHPNYTKADQLKVLYDLGFKRLSVGVQDFDPKVQFLINRIQTYESTKRVFDDARKIGYTSINADIIYGLPAQTSDSIGLTIENIKKLKPERIAFYSYAHVPWKSKSQRRYSEEDLPSSDEKRALYELGKNLLLEAGYHELGMDHFALPQDSLFQAASTKKLHRNFMGYTAQHTELLLGLGASSIGDTWTAFMQNIKEVEEYEKAISEGRLPLFKGHELTEEDKIIRKKILNLMCSQETELEKDSNINSVFIEAISKMKEMEEDGLLEIDKENIKVTPMGKPFLRNISMCLDARLWRSDPETQLFSKAI